MIQKNMIYEQVYYVNGPEEMFLNPIAIRPKVRDKFIEWEDTSVGTVFEFDRIEISQPGKVRTSDTPAPERIEIRTQKNQKITLKMLTLSIFNNEVRARVVGKPKFHSDQALREYYLNTDFDAY